MKKSTGIIFSVSGLSFWFFLAFPFANLNESYEWIAHVQTTPAWDLISSYVGHFASYRPLGQLFAILFYKYIHPSMFAIQFFNYLFSIAGIIFILKSHSGKAFPLFLSFFLMGAIFFPTFKYLFHLNGFFYSPLALLFGILYYFSQQNFFVNTIFKAYLITIIAALFHPFAIIIFGAFLLGWMVENQNAITKKIVIICITLTSSLTILFFVLVKEPFLNLTLGNLIGAYKVLASLENNKLILFISVAVSIVVVSSISKVNKTKTILVSSAVLLSIIFIILELPLIVLLVLACLAKLIFKKKWTLVSLMLVLIFFPLFAGTVSRSLKFLMLYLLPVAIALDIKWSRDNIQYLSKQIITVVPAILFILLVLLKLNVQIPYLYKIASSVLTARERSFQLDHAIEWLRHSGDKNYTVEILTPKNNEILPASSRNINAYLEKVNPISGEKPVKVFICFECDSLNIRNTMYSKNGIHSKKISLFEQ